MYNASAWFAPYLLDPVFLYCIYDTFGLSHKLLYGVYAFRDFHSEVCNCSVCLFEWRAITPNRFINSVIQCFLWATKKHFTTSKFVYLMIQWMAHFYTNSIKIAWTSNLSTQGKAQLQAKACIYIANNCIIGIILDPLRTVKNSSIYTRIISRIVRTTQWTEYCRIFFDYKAKVMKILFHRHPLASIFEESHEIFITSTLQAE